MFTRFEKLLAGTLVILMLLQFSYALTGNRNVNAGTGIKLDGETYGWANLYGNHATADDINQEGQLDAISVSTVCPANTTWVSTSFDGYEVDGGALPVHGGSYDWPSYLADPHSPNYNPGSGSEVSTPYLTVPPAPVPLDHSSYDFSELYVRLPDNVREAYTIPGGSTMSGVIAVTYDNTHHDVIHDLENLPGDQPGESVIVGPGAVGQQTYADLDSYQNNNPPVNDVDFVVGEQYNGQTIAITPNGYIHVRHAGFDVDEPGDDIINSINAGFCIPDLVRSLTITKECSDVSVAGPWEEDCDVSAVGDSVWYRITASTDSAADVTFTLTDDQTPDGIAPENTTPETSGPYTINSADGVVSLFTPYEVVTSGVGTATNHAAATITIPPANTIMTVNYTDGDPDETATVTVPGTNATLTLMKQCLDTSLTTPAWAESCTHNVGDTVQYRLVASTTSAGTVTFDVADTQGTPTVVPQSGAPEAGNSYTVTAAETPKELLTYSVTAAAVGNSLNAATVTSASTDEPGETLAAPMYADGGTSDEALVTVSGTSVDLAIIKECSANATGPWTEECLGFNIGDTIYYQIIATTNSPAGTISFQLDDAQDTPSVAPNSTLPEQNGTGSTYTHTVNQSEGLKVVSAYDVVAGAVGNSTNDLTVPLTSVSSSTGGESVVVIYQDESLTGTPGDTWHENGSEQAYVTVVGTNATLTLMKQCLDTSLTTPAWAESCTHNVGDTVQYRLVASTTSAGTVTFDVADTQGTPTVVPQSGAPEAGNSYTVTAAETPKELLTYSVTAAAVGNSLNAATVTSASTDEPGETLAAPMYADGGTSDEALVTVASNPFDLTLYKECSEDGTAWAESCDYTVGNDVHYRISAYTNMTTAGDITFQLDDLQSDTGIAAEPTGVEGVTYTVNNTHTSGSPLVLVTTSTDPGALVTIPTVPALSAGSTSNSIVVSAGSLNSPAGTSITPIYLDGGTEDEALITVAAGSIGDTIWYDTNQDGNIDAIADEPRIPGVTVHLYDGVGFTNLVDTQTTNASGQYTFSNLPLNTVYRVVVDNTTLGLSNPTQTYDYVGALDDQSEIEITTADPDDVDQDFGYIVLGTIGDYVWKDDNKDGVQDSDEDPISGVTASLSCDTEGYTATDVTDGNGEYLFENIPLNYLGDTTCTVTVSGLNGFEQTHDFDGVGTNKVSTTTIDNTGSGRTDRNQDFGFFKIRKPETERQYAGRRRGGRAVYAGTVVQPTPVAQPVPESDWPYHCECGQRVKLLQQWLNKYEYYIAANGYGSSGDETYCVGELTVAAMNKFQRDYNLPLTRYLDEATYAKIKALTPGYFDQLDESLENAVLLSSLRTPMDVDYGDHGYNIAVLDQLLRNNGYELGVSRLEATDSHYDIFTAIALMKYKIDNKLPLNTRVDSVTWASFNTTKKLDLQKDATQFTTGTAAVTNTSEVVESNTVNEGQVIETSAVASDVATAADCTPLKLACTNFEHQEDAQELFGRCASAFPVLSNIDIDGDGLVCESLPSDDHH